MVQLTIVVTCFGDSDLFWSNNNVTLSELANRSDIELIIVSTADISLPVSCSLLDLVKQSSNIKFITTKIPSKQGIGRNLGVTRGEGKYFWFIDSDDIFHLPDSDLLNTLHADLVSFNFVYEGEDGSQYLRSNGSNGLSIEDLPILLSCNRMSNACWPYFYSRKVLDAGISFGNYFFEDMVFNLRVVTDPLFSYQHKSSNLYVYKYNNKSTTRSKNLSKLFDRYKALFIVSFLLVRSFIRGRSSSLVSLVIYLSYHGVLATYR